MTDAHDDRAGLAAEYVLGTLDVDERKDAAALIEADPDFAALVMVWERRLGELHAMVDPVVPPPDLWIALRARLSEAVGSPRPGAEVEPKLDPDPKPELEAEPEAEPKPKPEAEPPGPAMEELLAAVAASLAEPVPPPMPPKPPAAPETLSVGAEAGPAAAVETPGPDVEAALVVADQPEAETTVVPVESPAESRALVVRPPSPDDAFDGNVGVGSATGHDAETVRGLVRSVQHWRSVAAGVAAFAAALTTLTVITALAPDLLPLPLRPPVQVVEVPREVVRTVEVPGVAPGRFVAVLQGNSARPAFLLTLDPDHKSVMVRRVAADDEGDKRYELWLVSDRLPAPHSLGLLGGAEFTTVPAIASFEPEIVDAAVYAVSLEASTGSPAAGPTGPVLFSGRLVEAVPPTQAGGH